MNIAYLAPFSMGFNRMKKALFQPFDIKKWFLVGFTAFLAGLMDWYHKGGNNNSNGSGSPDLYDIVNFPYQAWDWLIEHPWWFTLIISGVIFLLVLAIVFTWLSSRGKFMFLDNVVHDRAQVTKPWHDFKSMANSLFIWRFFFGFVCFAGFLIFIISCYFIVATLYNSDISTVSIIFSALGMGIFAFISIIITAYISLFLNDFIVPIMYKNNMNVLSGWTRFLPIFAKHLFNFLLYGLLIFVFYIIIFIGIIFLGLLTCCLGFILLIIPYIGSVITLPISYTFRAFSVEFLEQFGPEFKIFPEEYSANINPV